MEETRAYTIDSLTGGDSLALAEADDDEESPKEKQKKVLKCHFIPITDSLIKDSG